MNRFLLAVMPLSAVFIGLTMRWFGLPFWMYFSTGIVLLVIGGTIASLMVGQNIRKHT